MNTTLLIACVVIGWLDLYLQTHGYPLSKHLATFWLSIALAAGASFVVLFSTWTEVWGAYLILWLYFAFLCSSLLNRIGAKWTGKRGNSEFRGHDT